MWQSSLHCMRYNGAHGAFARRVYTLRGIGADEPSPLNEDVILATRILRLLMAGSASGCVGSSNFVVGEWTYLEEISSLYSFLAGFRVIVEAMVGVWIGSDASDNDW
jgi:hypothetical protein